MFDTELQRHLLTIEFKRKMSPILRTAHAQQSLCRMRIPLTQHFSFDNLWPHAGTACDCRRVQRLYMAL